MIAKTQKDIETLRAAGKLLSDALKHLRPLTVAGVTTASLDVAAEEFIVSGGGVPAFLNYKPSGARYPYPAALCISVNDEVVHGIPREEHVLEEGDVVTLDLGLSLDGYFVDSAITVIVGEGDAAAQKLLDGTCEALAAAVKAARVGGHIGDIGAAVEAVARRYNLTVVEELGGHAVGKSVHEQPFVPNVGEVGHGPKIVEGLVIAIEPILTEGKKGAIVIAPDEWTYLTKDNSRAAHFEQTVVVTKDGAEILTPF